MDADGTLNIFEQRPIWNRLATNLAFCFQLSEVADTEAISEKLQIALDVLTGSFAWIAGQVITEGANHSNSGVSKIVPAANTRRIRFEDHRQSPSVHSMQQLRESGYPVAMLEQTVFAPRPAAVAIPLEARPVLLIQANIALGGLVLVFSGDHAAMDMPGLMQIIRWFSKACHSVSFTPSELETGNMSRCDLIPLLGPSYQQGEELAQQVPTTPTAGVPPSRVPCTWATFKVPSCAVHEIKASAAATCTSPYVSTDDSLSAFVWQSVARARTQHLNPSTVSTVSRAVDVRKVLDIPSHYPGLVQNNLFHKLPLHELSTLPLGAVASIFREGVTSTSPSLAFYSRALATALSRSDDKSSLRVGANLDLSSDLIISSFTTSGAYQLDFALDLGRPEAVRITRQNTFEGIAYLLPFTPDGDATVLVCLRNSDLAALVADESFSRYAQHIG